MGDGFWVSSTQSEYSDMMFGLIGGMARRNDDTGGFIPLTSADPLQDKEPAWGNSFPTGNRFDTTNTFEFSEDPAWKFWKPNIKYQAKDFGLLRATMYAATPIKDRPSESELTSKWLKKNFFLKGPFLYAAMESEGWEGKTSYYLGDENNTDFVGTKNRELSYISDVAGYSGLTWQKLFGAKETDESWLSQALSQLVDSDLIISSEDDVADDVIARHSHMTTVLGSLGTEPSTSISAGATPTLPELSLPVWDEITWDTPLFTPDTVTDTPSITAPSLVEVEDNIDDAVAAFTAAANLRYAEEEGRIRASLYGARAHMSTYMENTLQLLAAKKQAEIAQFEKELRVEQTRQKVQVGVEYQQQTLNRNTQIASLTLEAEKINAANKIAVYEQEIRLALTKYESDIRRAISKYEAELRGAITIAELGTQVNVTKFQGDLQANVAEVEAALKYFDSKVSVLEAIYRAIVGTITLKAQNLGNASAVSGLIQGVIDNNLKSVDSRRNYDLNFEKTRVDLAMSASQAQSARSELFWKSQLQNMMVIKEAMSAIGATPQGTEHHPGGFEKMNNVLSSGLGAASGIMNIVSALT